MADVVKSEHGQVPIRFKDMGDGTNAEVVSSLATTSTGSAPTSATSTAYSASLIAKASPGTLYGVAGYNNGPGQWIQFHDSATLPANGSVPTGPLIFVAATSSFSIDFGIYGRGFVNGIVVCNSTTGPTKTIGAADCWFDARIA